MITDKKTIKEFSDKEVRLMYTILKEIHSGLTDKKNHSKDKLSVFEYSTLNSIEKIFKSNEKQE